MRNVVQFVSICGLLAAALLMGCSGSQPATPSSQTKGESHADHKGGEHKHDDHADHKDGGHAASDAETKANLAKLSVTDRESAEKQLHCPVSGDLLGSMGVPIKVTVNEKQIWICCKDCEEPLKADPEKYLAKLK